MVFSVFRRGAFVPAVLMLLLGLCVVAGLAATNENPVLRIGIDETVLAGLANNQSLRVQQIAPEIRRAREDREHARFDVDMTFEATAGRATAPARIFDGSSDTSTTRFSDARLGLGRVWSSGTQVGLDAGLRRDEVDDQDDRHSAGIDFSVAQPLLRGSGSAINRIGIRQAGLDTLASLYELHGFTEALVARIETAYWDMVLAGRNLVIVGESAQLAEQQMDAVNKRIDAGILAPTELAAAKAETALRRGALIRARGDYDHARLSLLHLMNPPVDRPWDLDLELTDVPRAVMPPVDDVVEHVAMALRQRPDLSQARLALERGELEVARTRNGLLPRLDLFVRLGRTAYADSFSASFEGFTDESPDLSVGLQWSQALGRRDARAGHRESQAVRQQAEAAVVNMEQLVQLDVRMGHIDVLRADEQVVAAAATRATHAEKLRAEMEKFQVGSSTALLVAQAQRDLMVARIAEEEAVVRAVKARIDLHRLDGSLLQRRGIEALP